MTTEDEFLDAQRRVEALPKSPGNDKLLELYGLYKQATKGDATGKRPGMFDLKGRAKFDAWSLRKGMTAEEARAAYVKLVDALTTA
jgi:diazepam-binding inhibitor (GABA receptor modulating acyl-CoA-binding protein)